MISTLAEPVYSVPDLTIANCYVPKLFVKDILDHNYYSQNTSSSPSSHESFRSNKPSHHVKNHLSKNANSSQTHIDSNDLRIDDLDQTNFSPTTDIDRILKDKTQQN